MATIPEALAIAVEHHQAGRLQVAETIYRQILQVDPQHVDANHLLGVLAGQAGNHALAVDFIARAIELSPNQAGFHVNLGHAYRALRKFPEAIACCRRALQLAPEYDLAHNKLGSVLRDSGQLAEAIASFRRAVELNPRFAEAHFNLGNALKEQGQLAEAVACYRRAVELNSRFAEAHFSLGNTLKEQGQLAEAVACFRRVIELEPNHAGALCNMGGVLKELGQLDEAIVSLRRALEVDPNHTGAHNNLGNALKDQGQLTEAIACYQRAIELEPNHAALHYNLGNVLVEQRQLPSGIACYRRAIELEPNHAALYYNLGNALKDHGQLVEAIACYRRAIELEPDRAEGHCNLGNALNDDGQLTEAIACFQRALQLRPDFVDGYNNLGDTLKGQGQLAEAIACYRQALQIKPDCIAVRSSLVFALHYHGDVTLDELAEAHGEFQRQHAAPLQSTWQPHDNVRDPDRPLRLGFVSPDFHQHPVAFLLVRVLENLESSHCEVVCYNDHVVADEVTARFQAAATTWRNVAGQSDQKLAEQIRADRIDILFDLAGYTGNNRLLVFARRPAPVQITWIGYEGTTGLEAIDYLLADRYVVPEDAERYCREKVVRMPDGYVCYDPPSAAPSVGPLPALEKGHITFGSFNNLAKIGPKVVAVWSEILRRVPESRLVLKYRGMGDEGVRRRYLDQFAAGGVEPNRLELLPPSSYAEYFAAYGPIDIALDPFPFSGSATTCGAIWMGVPVITCPGETFASRHSLSHLSNIGLLETIVSSLDDYVKRAVSLAGDLPRLAALRAGLREQMAASPLCDGKRFAANLMPLLRNMWREWVERPFQSPTPSVCGTAYPFRGNISTATIPEALAIALEHHQAGRAGNHTLAEAHFNLGNTLTDQGQLDEAIVAFRRALEVDPNHAGAHNNLGNAMKGRGQLTEAIACYQRALELESNHAEGHYNLGNALVEQRRLTDAIACYRRAIDLNPDYVDAHNNLGNALKEQGQLAEAISCYRQALRLKPDCIMERNNLLLALHYQSDVTLDELAEAHGEFQRHHAAPLRSVWQPHDNVRDPRRRLRLGFVSPDFHQHPVGFFLIRILENLDHSQCDIVCYNDYTVDDQLTARFQAAATTWRDVAGQNDQALAEQVRADRIDILFDLAGHTENNRLLVFARKPAPVQITWIGYEGTTGLEAMDYLLADRYVVPEGAERYCREKIVQMPAGYVCYDPPAAAPPVSSLPALEKGYITFGSFNNLAKIGPKVVAVWSEILRRVPKSRLALKYNSLGDETVKRRYLDQFAAAGVEPHRLELLPPSSYAEYLAAYGQMDIALDPFPFSGSATTCDALWMGVPVITCPGETFASRHSLSHLSNLGLVDLIACNQEDYIRRAVSLAGDLPRLATLRAGLREQMAASPLCDGKRFAANLMPLLRNVWQEWVEKPFPIPDSFCL